MLKFLRQYNQWILVVGGTLLLITFLMPTAIQSCAQQSAVSGAVWATYSGGKTITGADLENARQEIRIVELVGNRLIAQIGADREPAHWWLLAHEAKLSGLVGDLGDGEALVSAIAAQRAEQAKTTPNVIGTTPDQMLSLLVRESRASRELVLSALAKLQGVSRLLNLASNVDRVSDRRYENSIALASLGLSGNITIIDARKSTAIEVAASDDAALQAHFAKFADKAAPAADAVGRENFGYRVPDRFKIEWMRIPKASIDATIANSPELATLALKKRFAQNPAKYGAPSDGSAAFATYEATVRSKTVEELAQAQLEAISKFATDQLALAQRTLKRDGMYFVLPADWTTQMPALDQLAQSIATEFSIAAPSYASSGEEWLVAGDIDTKLQLGFLSTDRFGQPLTLSALLQGAKELSNPNQTAPFQMNIASPPFKSAEGDVVFVRLIAAEPSRAAAALADVRDAVAADVASLARFEWLEKNQDAITKQAIDEGLTAVATRFGSQVAFAKDIREANPQFLQFGFRVPGQIPGLGADPEAIRSLVTKAAKLPFTEDLSKVPVADRTFVVAAPDRLSLVVMQVSELAPLTKEVFETIAANPQSVGVVMDPDVSINPMDLFSYDALAKRYDFQPSRLESDEDAAIAEEDAEAKG